jgi:hypothetical protein
MTMDVFQAREHFAANHDRDELPPDFEAVVKSFRGNGASIADVTVTDSEGGRAEFQSDIFPGCLAAVVEWSGRLGTCRDDSDLDTCLAIAVERVAGLSLLGDLSLRGWIKDIIARAVEIDKQVIKARWIETHKG